MNGTENRFILEWTATYRAELVCFELCDLRWRRVAMVISLCVSHDWLSFLNGAVTANTKAVSRRKWRIYFVFYLTGREKPEGETENKPLRVILTMTMTFTCKCGITLIDLCAKDQFCLHLSNVWTWLWRCVCMCAWAWARWRKCEEWSVAYWPDWPMGAGLFTMCFTSVSCLMFSGGKVLFGPAHSPCWLAIQDSVEN